MKRRWFPLVIGLGAVTVAGVLIVLRPDRRPAVDAPAAPEADLITLNPAAVPDRATALAAEGLIPGGQGDRAVIDHDGHRVVRVTATGDTRWAAPLDGYLGRVRPPHVVSDADLVHVTHAGGVTALDARTGAVAWRSPGPKDRLLLSGDLLLATDCSIGEEVKEAGRWFVARSTRTGADVFRVALPAERFDPLPIEEAAGLFVVQTSEDPGGAGLALLIDRAGRVHHRFDRQVVAVAAAGPGRVVLTSRDVVGLAADGSVRWAVPFRDREWVAGGGLVPAPGGDLVAFVYCAIANSGVQVLRMDPMSGRKAWWAECDGLPDVAHSAYQHDAVLVVEGGWVMVTSRGSAGTFVEALDAQSGIRVGRRIIKE